MTTAKSAIREFLERPLRTYVWMKSLPESLLWEQIESLDPVPVFKTKPRKEQLVCFLLGLRWPRWMLLLDMGLGKSKAILDLLSYAKRRGMRKRALILAPRLVNLGGWEEQIQLHSDLSFTLVTGEIEEKRRLLESDTDVVVIDQHGFQLAMSQRRPKPGLSGKEELIPDQERIDVFRKAVGFIGIDEIHKVRSHDSSRFKILRRLTSSVDYCYGLTGSPFGRDPIAVWPQFFLVDRGRTFGPTLGIFRDSFFIEERLPWATRAVDYRFDKRKYRLFYRMMQHGSIRYSEDECLELPEKTDVRLTLKWDAQQREAYVAAVDGLIRSGGNFKELDAVYLRLRQICAGYLEWKEGERKMSVTFPTSPKLDALEELLDSLPEREKVLVFCFYVRTGELIQQRLEQLKIPSLRLYGGTKNPLEVFQRFKTDPKVRVLIANHESGGTGLNIQFCRYVVFFESPSAPDDRRQAEKRVWRPGQTSHVFVYDLVMERSIDVKILRDIAEGRDLFDSLVEGKVSAKSLLD